MNNFHTEDLLKIAKNRSQQDILATQLTKNTKQVSFSKRTLSILGTWMVAGGEKLQALNAESLQENQAFSQHKSRKVQA